MTGNRAVFFDLDGTLVRTCGDNLRGPRIVEEVQFLTDRAELLVLSEAGYLSFVITNQPDIARGLLDQNQYHDVRRHIQAELPIEAFSICPHDGHWCACRKPRPGMIYWIALLYELDLSHCWVVGDSERDMSAGRAAGCKTYRIETNQGITEAARWILGH